MAKRKRRMDPKRIKQLIDEGRGSGEGPNYKGWLTIHDVTSKGLRTRVWSEKAQRAVHLFSLLELYVFFLLEFMPDVLDVREQYPLLPQSETLNIAKSLNVRHPRPPYTSCSIVMTTDFLLTRHSGTSTRYEAWCVKYEGDLLNRRTLQKLEIERLFWRKHDIPWRIVTERSLPRTVAANLQYLHPFLGLEPGSLLSTEQWQALTPLLFSRITQGVILAEIAEDIDKILRIPTGTTLQAVRFLMAKQMWPVDIRVPINFRKPLVLLPNQCLRRVE